MDQTQSLHKLLESADLVGMLEDLLRPERIGELSPSSWSGMRITLRSLHDNIMASHAELSKGVVQAARSEGTVGAKPLVKRTIISTTADDEVTLPCNDEKPRDLKSALEQFVER